MAKYQVLAAGFVQPVTGPDGRPATQTRQHGEVFEHDPTPADAQRFARAVERGRLKPVDDDAEVTALSAAVPTSTSPTAPVRLATGQGNPLTVADFRTVEQASVGTVVGVETSSADPLPAPGEAPTAPEPGPAGPLTPAELAAMSVDDVGEYLTAHPDQADTVRALEEAGKARKGVLDLVG